MKTIKTLTFVLVGFILGHFCGSHVIYMSKDCHKDGTTSFKYPHFYNIKKDFVYQREYNIALLAGLHRFYSNDDNEKWFSEFMKTKEYQAIDSLNEGNWEDFYEYSTPPLEDWYAVYGTEFEPSQEFKDSVHFVPIDSIENI